MDGGLQVLPGRIGVEVLDVVVLQLEAMELGRCELRLF